MNKTLGPEAVYLEREPFAVTRVYAGTLTEDDEEFPFTMTTQENPETGAPELVTDITFTEGEPINKRAAVAAIKDHF